MIMGIICGLLVGWIFKLFGFYQIVDIGILTLFNIHLNVETYYFLFAILGALLIRVEK